MVHGAIGLLTEGKMNGLASSVQLHGSLGSGGCNSGLFGLALASIGGKPFRD